MEMTVSLAEFLSVRKKRFKLLSMLTSQATSMVRVGLWSEARAASFLTRMETVLSALPEGELDRFTGPAGGVLLNRKFRVVAPDGVSLVEGTVRAVDHDKGTVTLRAPTSLPLMSFPAFPGQLERL